jgi:polar amino acid transport system substrate-binding protein
MGMSNRGLLKIVGGCLLLVFTLAACGDDDSSEPGPSADCEATVSFKTLKEGVLNVGVYVEPPYTEPASDGTMGGVDGEVLKEIAAESCLKLETTEMAGAALFENVDAGRVDAAVGAIGLSEEREELYDYAGPIYLTQLAYVSKDDVQETADLDGKKIGVVAGYAWNTEYQEMFGDSVTVYQTNDALLNDLVAGRVEVGLYDAGDAEYAVDKIGKSDEFNINVAAADPALPTTEAPRQTVFLLPKGNAEAAEAMTQVIGSMRSSGDLAEILESHGLPEESNIEE